MLKTTIYWEVLRGLQYSFFLSNMNLNDLIVLLKARHLLMLTNQIVWIVVYRELLGKNWK